MNRQIAAIVLGVVLLASTGAVGQRGEGGRSPAGERASERADRPDHERPDHVDRERVVVSTPTSSGELPQILLTNECGASQGQIYVAIFYWDSHDWIVRGWWGVNPGQTINTGVPNSRGSIYFYAEGGDKRWSGDGASGSISLPVVSGVFAGASDHLAQRADRRYVSFLKMETNGGRYTQGFSCS